MITHRGFPGRLPGTDFQFTIRRANPKGVTPIRERVRHPDRDALEARADTAFMHALWHHFGTEPFERGNLDAGRLCWLIGREVVAVDKPFNPASYDTLLQIDETVARANFPDAFEEVLEA